MIKIHLLAVFLTIVLSGLGQDCQRKVAPQEDDFEYKVQFAHFETDWYAEWLSHTDGKMILPEALPPKEKWEHPYMKYGYTSAMHEDAHASDVSNLPGPIPKNVEVQYFHVLEKGGDFSGMAPTYAFIDDTTMVTLSFGRANTTLLLVDIKDTIKVLDKLSVPGRGNKALELAGKKGRSKIFSNTAGGAYSYLSGKDKIYIPGANNNILRIIIVDRKFNKDDIGSINLIEQIEAANLDDEYVKAKDGVNLLTALMPDVEGNIWFTSRLGVIGLIHREDRTSDGCPKVYGSFIQKFGLNEKLMRLSGVEYSDKDLEDYTSSDTTSNELRLEFREEFDTDPTRLEEIQNSFSVGKDGVYIVTNFALYKMYFNENTKQIEMDPKWEKTLEEGDLVYNNDGTIKPGHLNAGSGSTPTLMGDDFVAIGDNDTNYVNLCVYSQETGKLIFKHPLFSNVEGSAVENSIVAYDGSFVVANQYGYTDPFVINNTAGGIMRFDFNDNIGNFELVKGWPESGLYDCKTATPKLSTASGMLYVYNRSDSAYNDHNDWQVTAIDFRTGLRVFFIKPYLNKGEFDDNIGPLLKWGSLGSKNYDRKVFNNIWGTFTFGPENSFYIGAYRGFIRVKSD